MPQRILENYKNQRLQDFKSFGTVREISRDEFTNQVASPDHYCVVHLYQNHNTCSQLLTRILVALAHKYNHIKFLKIVATRCIENYPDRNVPTLLVYHKGDVIKQWVGAEALGGVKTSESFISKLLYSARLIDDWEPAKGEKLESEEEEDEYA
jgi:hypothetical protein